MPENASLSGNLDQFDLDFVEREATPRLLMKLSIQLHLAGLSLSNTVSVLEIFGVQRARSTVHNWVHKADLQPEDGQSPDHVAVDETVIQLNDDRYWLYAAVDPETNKLLHTKLGPTTTKVLAQYVSC
jgi:transposase-like protein